MRKQLRQLLCLMLGTLLLGGCAARPASSPGAALPSPEPGPEAPLGDAGLKREAIVPLHLPSLDGQTLLTFYETMALPLDRHPAESVVQALLAHEGNSRVDALGGHVTLALSGANPVELSGSVCTVNLSASALQLSSERLYTVALAITATLCEMEDIDHVNLLIAGTPLGMDVGGNLPLGTLTTPATQELPVLWKQFLARRAPVGELPAHTPLTATATLYFPLSNGRGILAEPRRLSFPGQHPQQQVATLLSALSAGADLLSGVADLPDLNELLLFLPEVTDLENGGRRVTLHFTADVKEQLLSAGCDPSATFAAITTTLTTFVPSLQQLCILVGNGALTSLYSEALGSMLFPGGLMSRADFSHALMRQSTVFVPAGHGVTPMLLSLPYRSAGNPRTLLLSLASPEVGALPEGLTDADILGLSVEGDTLLLNLSTRYADVLRTSELPQRTMAYSMVSTLCHATGTRRMRCYFGGEAVESLGSSLVWNGEFLFNPALIVP
ncbi:MAG: GerMN domain-containing protein [Clostridiales bacterium]|nr:GerMN domain-containing protein [Clostridiales bacterium]